MSLQTSFPFSAEALMARAREITGIDRIDDYAIEPLTVYCKALNDESQLHANGVVETEKRLLRLLCNRLRMQRDFGAHPEIAEQQVKAPVFVNGAMRTGSSKMQRVLAATGDFNFVPGWQGFNPALWTGDRGESPQPRIDYGIEYVQRLNGASPYLKYGHDLGALEAEEESFIYEHSLTTAIPFGWSPIPSYLAWLAEQDPRIPFRYLLDTLKYLQWQGLAGAGKRWILKCPLNLGLEPFMVEIFPDATFIMTHRHPTATIPSTCRMTKSFSVPHTDADPDYNGILYGFAAQTDAHLKVRDAHPGIPFIDVNYRDLISSPETVVEAIYSNLGMALSERAVKNIRGWEAAHPKGAHGAHRYSLADFNFTEQQVSENFKGYIAFLDRMFGDSL